MFNLITFFYLLPGLTSAQTMNKFRPFSLEYLVMEAAYTLQKLMGYFNQCSLLSVCVSATKGIIGFDLCTIVL